MSVDTDWQEYVDSLDDVDTVNPHQWQYGGAIRECSSCGEREAYWDDDEYPINPCRAAWEEKREDTEQ